MPAPERAALIRKAASLLEQHRAEFERWLVREGRAIPGKGAFEVDLVLSELWEVAALPRVSLELGGNNALIVLDDADLDAASSAGRGARSCTRDRSA